MAKTLTIVGYKKCPYFNQVCLFGTISKNRKRCADYKIVSFDTRTQFSKWVDDFVKVHSQSRVVDSNTSPFVYDEDHKYFGGYSEMFDLMQDDEVHG